MTITQLPSGSFRIRYYGADKKQKSITIDHKPTRREAERLISEAKEAEGSYAPHNDSFEAVALEYIAAKYNVLSPNTRRGYGICLKRLSEAFKGTPINSIDQLCIQREINSLSASYAPKTVRNTHGFISAILDMYRPNLNVHTKLPMKTKTDSYCPTNDDIKMIMEKAKGTRYYVPFALGIMGMRRGEIAAATINDLDGNLLTISKGTYIDEMQRHGVKDTPKTTDSIRQIYLPNDIADLIREQKCVYDGAESRLWATLTRYQQELGIPHFRFHDLRVYYASYAHAMGIPDKYIQEGGGWKSDYTMKQIYRKAMKDEYKKSQEEYIDKIKGLF